MSDKFQKGDIVKIAPEWLGREEPPDRLYVVVEVVEYDNRRGLPEGFPHIKVDITPLGTGLRFPGINTVRPESIIQTGERVEQ